MFRLPLHQRRQAVATISIAESVEGLEFPEGLPDTEYELLSEEDLETMINQEENYHDMEQMEDMKRPEDENIVPQDRVEETNITETNSIAE